MYSKQLSRLEKVDLREAWNSESRNFTPWLAQENNLLLLSETLQMNLKLEGIELPVGGYFADILCKDLFSDKLVLIENQLEVTDHSHLGQILTYAAGLGASVIVWICKAFNEEHRAALDWLNDNTGDNLHFFGIEIELWKIGNSLPAPSFNTIVQPDGWYNWIAQVAKKNKSTFLSDCQEFYLTYWIALTQFLMNVKEFRSQKPHPENYLTFSTGKSNVVLAAKINLPEKYVEIEIYLSGSNAKKYYFYLLSEKEVIEKEIGSSLSWQEMPQKVASRILLKHENIDVSCLDEWQNQHSLIKNSLNLLQNAFLPRIKLFSIYTT